jgi:hypothetical protein
MTPLEALARWLGANHAAARVVLVRDPEELVPAAATAGPYTVLEAAGNVAFRLAWSEARRGPGPWLVLRRRPEVFLADLEARAATEGLMLDVSPRRLLAWGSGCDDWPAWVDREPRLTAQHYAALTRERRRLGAASAEAVEALCLRQAVGFDLTAEAEPAEIWQTLFERAELLAGLHQRKAAPALKLQAWLKLQAPPLSWIDLADPARAVRVTWLTAILTPHVADPAELLPRLYPAAAMLKGRDASAVARVAYRLSRRARKLAASQLAQAEAALAGPLRAATVRHLGLDNSAAAAALVHREQRSGLLALMALRTLLEAAADRQLPPDPALEADLEALLGRAKDLSESKAVAAHAGLLRALLRLDRLRRRIAEAPPAATPAATLRRAAAWLVDASLGDLPEDVRAAKEALTRNALSEPSYHPRPDMSRHKAALKAIYQRLDQAEAAYRQFEQTVAQAAVAHAAGGGGGPELTPVTAAWEQTVAPLLADAGRPKVTAVVVAGLDWWAWETLLAPRLGALADIQARPALAPLPATAALSLRRALAGPAWRPAWAELGFTSLLKAARPELAWRKARPPKAAEPLAAAGALAWSGGAGLLRLLVVDLLASHPAGAPMAVHRERVEALAAALAGLVGGGRDEAVVLLGASGAAACEEAAGLALPGRALGARGLAVPAASEPPAGVLTLAAGAETCWLAVGPQRLAPAAAEAVMADGGLSLGELAVPLAVLAPTPPGERSTVQVGQLIAPEAVAAGQLAQAGLWCSLAGGALAEVAVLTLKTDGAAPVEATLDLGERRWLTAGFRLAGETGEVTLEAECRVGRRVFRRRTLVQVTAATREEPASAERNKANPASEVMR